MLLNFAKMHGLGNDFVVIDLITQPARLRKSHIKRIADRNLGVGCDQVLLLEPPTRSKADFFYRIFNADGQEVEQCGNGIRCVARFFYDMGFTNNPVVHIDCMAGELECKIEEKGSVTVNMGIPKFKPEEIPFITKVQLPTYPFTLDNTELSLSVLSMGNPHAVLIVENLELAPVKKLGSQLSKHPAFPKGINVGFMEIKDRSHIRLRVYERGVGETKACGTGACAAAVSGIKLGLLETELEVGFSTGNLKISWQGENTPLYMTGPVTRVFVGRFRL